MPSRPIDTAVVEILPELGRFGPLLDRALGRAFRDLEIAVDAATRDVTREFDRMGDSVDGVFRGVASVADRSFADVALEADLAAAGVSREFEMAGEHTEDAFREMALTADRQLDKIDRHATTSAAGMQKKFSLASLGVGAALLGIGAAATAGLGALTVMGLTSAATLEQTKISFDSLLGSAEKGQEVFTQLQDFAAKTPFEFPDIASAGKRFLAFANSVGLSRDQLLQYLTTIGNVISVTGGGADAFGRINLAIGQIGSASKVTLDNLNQIADAIPGFSPIAAIAEGFGVTTAQAMAMVSAGAIPAAAGVQAILKGMEKFPGAAGAMEKQSQTLLGVFSTFKDVVGQTLAQAFAPSIPKIKDTLAELTPIIGDALAEVAPALGDVLGGILPLIASLVKGITPILTPLLHALGPALESLGPALEPLGEALGQVIIPLTPILPLIANLAVAIVTLLIPVIQLLAIVLKPLEPILSFLAKAVGQFVTWLTTIKWGEVGNAIAHGFVVAWQSVVKFFKAIGSFFASLPERIRMFVESIPRLIGNLFKKLFDLWLQAIGVGIAIVIFTFTQLPGRLITAVINLDRQFGAWLVRTFISIKDRVIAILVELVAWAMTLPDKIMSAIISLPGRLATFFVGMFNRVKSIVLGAIDSIVGFFKSLPARLAGFAASVGGGITNFIKNFLNHAIDQINTGISKVDDFLPGSLPRLPRLAHGGIFTGPAIVGEDSSTTPEAAIPLGDARAMSMLRDALGAGGPRVTFEANSIVVNVNGSDMTKKQAASVGQTIGSNIADVLTRTGIRTAVRTA